MPFEFSTLGLGGKSLVAFEKLYAAEGEVAKHEDIKDEGQTVYVPEIGTTLIDTKTTTHSARAEKEVVLEDSVEYKNLIPKKTYIMRGRLVEKESGKVFLSDGKPVTAETTFKPESANGSVKLTFKFNGEDLRGKSVVAFEQLFFVPEGSKKEKKLTVHEDIKDEGQTVHFPKIGTTLVEKGTKKSTIEPKGETILVDTIKYENLIVGQKYHMFGKLMDKETGKPLLVEGKEVVGSVDFTAKEANGSVDIEFKIDASKLNGKRLVAFEKLFTDKPKKEIANHEDINDVAQTVDIGKPKKPEIGTSASVQETQGKMLVKDGESTVLDDVKYKGLDIGEEYIMKGVLVDKETGKPLEGVSAEKAFKPEAENGHVTLEFKLPKGDYEGKTFVAFEELFKGDKPIAEHKDLKDEAQSVYGVKLRTKASTASGNVIGSGKQDIKDTIYFENLEPGYKYLIDGTLMVKETGEPLKDKDGKVVHKTLAFSPKERKGEVEMIFEGVDTSGLEGKTLVAFERLYSENEVLIGSHTDINDQDQSVQVKKPLIKLPEKPIEKPMEKPMEKPKEEPKTFKTGVEDNAPIILGAIAVITVGAIAAYVISVKKRQAK